MADKSFEQRVREELGSLKMRPDEAVWAKVEADLHKEKKRRWIVWLFLFAALGGGAFWYWMAGEQKPGTDLVTSKQEPAQQQTAKIENEKTATITPDQSNATTKGNTSTVTLAEKPSKSVPTQKIIISESAQALVKEIKNKITAEQKAAAAFGNKRLEAFTNVSETKKNQGAKEASILTTDAVKNDPVQQKTESNSVNSNVAAVDVQKETVPLTEPGSQKTGTKAPVAVQEKVDIPGVTDTTKAAQTIYPKKESKKKWQFSVAGDMGRSALVKGLFSTTSSSLVNSSPNSPITAPGNGGPGVVVTNPPPDVKNAMGFGLRFEASKALNNKFSIDLFGGYTLLQTATRVGKRVDTVVNSNSAFSGLLDNRYYFRNTDSVDYTNRYHYLSLGASLSTSFKLFGATAKWKLGGGFNYLIGSNGLHYDNTTGFLYQNKSMFTQLQPFLTTGFDFPIGKKSFMYIGPHLQYNVRALSSESPDHLLFGSIRFSFLLPRKK